MTDEDRQLHQKLQTVIEELVAIRAELHQVAHDQKPIKELFALLTEGNEQMGVAALIPWLLDLRKTVERTGWAGRWIMRVAAWLLAATAGVVAFSDNIKALLARVIGG